MMKSNSILLTTAPSKDGTIFGIESLESALKMGSVRGVTSCLGHDFTKPVGWTIPKSIYIEPGLGRLVGETWIAESNVDQMEISRLHYAQIIRTASNECTPYVSIFEKGLDGFLTKDYKLLSSTFVACFDRGVVGRYYEKLMSNVDKDGLVYLEDLLKWFDYLGQGVFKDKKSEFAIVAHSYFRKSLSLHNNLNYYFLDELLKHKDNKNVKLRLRLDLDLIGISETYLPAMEFEYWRGPVFNNDVKNIKLGVSVHKMDEYNNKFNNIDRTEFLWKIESGEQAFEVEEVKDQPSWGVSKSDYGCRYAHSIYDTKVNAFNHFDGAIRMYDEDQMIDRLDADIKSAGKRSRYTKLFRIDGNLPLEDWKLLLHHYFQGNYLIEEYFQASDKRRTQIELVDTQNESSEHRVVPVALSKDDGLRVAVSYLPVEKISDNSSTHQLVGYDTFGIEGFDKLVELDIIELRKSLEREGYKLTIDGDCKFIECYDGQHWNIPMILVKNDKFIDDYIFSLITGFRELLVADNQPRKIVSFTFAWQDLALDRQVVLSFLGTSEVLINWFTYSPFVPTEPGKFKEWIGKLCRWLESYSTTHEKPAIFDVLCSDGTLFIKREPILKYAKIESVKITGSNVKFAFEDKYNGPPKKSR